MGYKAALKYISEIGTFANVSNFAIEEITDNNGDLRIVLSFDRKGEYEWERKKEYREFYIKLEWNGVSYSGAEVEKMLMYK